MKNFYYINIAIGVLLWIVTLALSFPFWNIEPHIHLLLLTNILLFVPLTLMILSTSRPQAHTNRLFTIAKVSFVFPAILVTGSFLFKPGISAGALAIPWFVFTIVFALYGLQSLLGRGTDPVEEALIDYGLLLLPVGGVWLLMYRFGIQPLNFSTLIVSLTAVHFHILSVGALLLSGVHGRLLNKRPSVIAKRIYLYASLGLVIAPIIVAAGITFSLVFEVIGAFLMAGSLLSMSLLALRFNIGQISGTLRKMLLVVSCISLFLTMALAIGYPVGRFSRAWVLTIPQMVYLHGYVNTFGFALTGLVAFAWMSPDPRNQM